MSELFDLCDEVLRLVGDRAEVEVTATAGTSSLTRFANSFVHQNVGEELCRLDLRVAVDGRLAGASTTRTSPEELAGLVEDTLAAARLRPVDPDWPGLAPPAPASANLSYDEATDRAAPDERAVVARDFVRAAPDLKAAGYCMTEATEVAFANSAGQRVGGRVTMAAVDGIHQTGTSAGSAHRTSSRLADIDGDTLGMLAADRARRAMNADDLEPGDYEVVLGPMAVAEVVRFLAFYGFNGKAITDGQSFVRAGEQQFDERIALVDDVGDNRAVGPAFDIEGTPRRRLELIRDGVTVGVVHDRRTAARAGAESTGHASSEGDGPVPVNLFLGAGDASQDELAGRMSRGLLVNEFNYCRVLDPKTQVVTGLTRNGTFLVEDGRITGAVNNLRFTQSFVAALAPGAVLGVGNDGMLANGDVWAPSLHLASWSFTGGARG